MLMLLGCGAGNQENKIATPSPSTAIVSSTVRDSFAASPDAGPTTAASTARDAGPRMRLVRFTSPDVEVEIEETRIANAAFNGYYSAVNLSDGSGFRVVRAGGPYPESEAELLSHARVYGAIEPRAEVLSDGLLVRGVTRKQPRFVVLVVRELGGTKVLCDAAAETEASLDDVITLCKSLRATK
jgi:hypothetical protein